MKNRNEKGFSLIELLLVVVIIGIIAAIGVPALQKALIAAQNRNTYATMRSIHTTQVGFYSQNSRFGRFGELNSILGNGLGTVAGNQMFRGKYTFEMVPAAPTDVELRDGYTILATRDVLGEPIVYQYEITQAGKITRILPGPEVDQ